ncbi:chloroquine resistance protein [Francisella marina]|uniref:Chloroquine resistance protein n=1 Tax=Francisella marina TaxID=2249302 RepID=A0ABX5ZFA8_9GAMM|nr:chloroquine resistance protein [Francisella marina]QEO56852.1 chloroquine resistance protein [Francisella marina]QEO59029.1 chloroquine resistance protein [Francisella marina]
MDFVRQVEDIFDIDIWELKPAYSSIKQTQSEIIDENSHDATKKELEIIYTNIVDSSKIINILLSDKLDIGFLKQVANSLFFKSSVYIYKSNDIKDFNDLKGINLSEKDFICDNCELLKIQNKKAILSNLYKYADFRA